MSISLRNGIVKRPAPHHNVGKPTVLSRLPVGFLSAKHRCGIPTPSRISYKSCGIARPFSFHVAREATLMLRESCCCQVLSATMCARDPRAHHHSSSRYWSSSSNSETSDVQHPGHSVFSDETDTHVQFPSRFTRQYNFAMLNASVVYT